jgi:hypothetical protein
MREALWTPNGLVSLSGPKPERVELRPGLIEWFCQADAVFKHFGLGLHCSKCKADVIGKNGANDRVFTAACQCREFVGQNREYREPTAEVAN